MATKKHEAAAENYLKMNSRLKGVLLDIKEEAKRLTGREFGTHAERGTGAYERMLRETLDAGILLIAKSKRLYKSEKEIVRLRLIHDYEYGFRIREEERINKEEIANRPKVNKDNIHKRTEDIEARKRENIRRVAEKFLGWRDRNA